MEFFLAIGIGVVFAVAFSLVAVSLLEAVGVALSAWMDQGEDDL